MLPMYLWVVLGLILCIVAFCILYYQLYKRHINRVLANGTPTRKPMPAPLHVALAATLIFLLCSIGISFVVGFGMGYRALDGDEEGQIDVNTICAQIKEIQEYVTPVESLMTVETVERNYEPDCQIETFLLYEGLMIEQDGQPISVSDLKEGQFVSIVLLTDLGGVEDIFKIEVIDREV